jgi:hypothetical protein
MDVCDRPGRAGTALGLLITQRSRVQIPPPLPNVQVRGLFPSGRGLLAVSCAREIVHKPFGIRLEWLSPEHAAMI